MRYILENIGRLFIGGLVCVGIYMLYITYTPFGVWFSAFVGGIAAMSVGWIIKQVGEKQTWIPEEY